MKNTSLQIRDRVGKGGRPEGLDGGTVQEKPEMKKEL